MEVGFAPFLWHKAPKYNRGQDLHLLISFRLGERGTHVQKPTDPESFFFCEASQPQTKSPLNKEASKLESNKKALDLLDPEI